MWFEKDDNIFNYDASLPTDTSTQRKINSTTRMISKAKSLSFLNNDDSKIRNNPSLYSLPGSNSKYYQSLLRLVYRNGIQANFLLFFSIMSKALDLSQSL